MQRTIFKALLAASALGVSSAALADLAASCTDTSTQFFSSVDTPNSAISDFTPTPPAEFGEICITLTSPTTAKVEAQTSAGFLMGDGGTLGLVVNANSFTFGAITGNGVATGIPHNGPLYTVDTSNGNVDGFGHFNFIIDSFDGFHHASSDIMFTLTDTSGTFTSASNVLTTNANGADAEMHIFVCNDPACSPTNTSAGAKATGFAAEGPGTITETPEPATLALVGMGLVGLGLKRKERKNP